ncbi:MAG: hypothetical protein ACKO66_04295 [Flavobacteriales bacterium]
MMARLAVSFWGDFHAQTKPVGEMKWFTNEEKGQFVKLTFCNQAWMRYAQNNPGSGAAGNGVFQREAQTTDIGLRRTRFQLMGKVSDRFFFYTQFGMNNFNYLSARKTGFFIHDALGEMHIAKQLDWGMGLTAWTGFSRFSSPGVASIMGLDAPLFLQATNDANDQFLRKLSTYVKGKLGKLDYRLVVSKPMEFAYSTLYKKNTISADAQFAPTPPRLQTSGYVSYQFLDQEANMLPYQVGTYLGKKRVFNVGAGFQYQPRATWSTANAGQDTVYHDMKLFSADLYYDAPLNANATRAISIYAVGTHYDFGTNYIRNLGIMNTTDSVSLSLASFNGTGVAYPMIGSGNSIYVQLGYLGKPLAKDGSAMRLMPYIACQYSMYQKLNDPMVMVDGGVSLYVDEARSKLTLSVQNRPVFKASTDDSGTPQVKQDQRLNAIMLQYQVSY